MLQAIYKPIFKQKKKLIVAVLALVAVGLLIPSVQPIFAASAWNWWCLLTPAGCVVVDATKTSGTAALKLLATVFLLPPLLASSIFLAIVGACSSWIITLTLKTSYLLSPAVVTGWPIVRNFANIIIVLALIIISMATILRYREYEAKKLLPSLIIAALLINFSLVICGLFIDGSNLIVKDFLSREGGALSSNYSGKALTSAADIFEKIWEQKIGLFQFMARMAGHIFYNTMAGVVLLLYLFLFLFRVIALWILLILSPLAFACYILPTTRKFFDTWWSNFIQWIMIGMTGSFFYWLASSLRDSLVAVNPSTTLKAGGTLLDFTDLISFIVPGTFLVIGFMFAIQTSAMGSGMAISGFKKTIGTIRTGATAGGKFLADNTGLTRAKNAVVDRATRIGENIGLVSRGTADANRKARQTGELDEKGRVDRAKGMSTQQKLDAVKERALTRAASLNKAAVLKEMTKEEFGMLSPQEQMSLVQEHQQYGLKPHEMVGKMSTANQNDVVRNNLFDAKTREEALKTLAAKGQLDSSVSGNLTQDEIIRAMTEARANGSDLKDIISGLRGMDLAQILTEHQDAVAVARSAGIPTGPSEIFNASTRAKILKALADKKQLDLIGQVGESIERRRQRKIEAMLEAQNQGVLPQDIVAKMNSEDQAHIINNANNTSDPAHQLNRETRGQAVESLRKKKELNQILPANRQAAYQEAIETGASDIEDIEIGDYRAGSINEARINKIENAQPGLPGGRTTYEQMARDEVLDENIGSMNGDQLKDIDVADLTGPAGSLQYRRVTELSPDKLAKFQSASPAHRAALKAHLPAIDAEITNEREEAINANQGYPIGTRASTRAGLKPDTSLINTSQGNLHTTKADKLRKIRTVIFNLP